MSDDVEVMSRAESEAFQRALLIAGSQAKLAAIVGGRQGNVSQRATGKRRVPAEWCVPIWRATGVTPHELRPDIYPPELSLPSDGGFGKPEAA